MSKMTVVGDPHAKPDNLDKIDQLFDMIEHLRNPTVILGDLLDTKEVVRGKCLNKYIERFQKAQSIEFYVLVGNHDWFNLECKQHSLEVLKLLPNVTVVDTPLYIPNVTLLPYTNKPSDFKQAFGEDQIVFCHADIKGFDYGNGRISEEGMESAEITAQVISGHYHKFQQVGNITYLGTPFSHTFGEANQTKFLGVVDLKTRLLELIPTNFPSHRSVVLDVHQPEFEQHHQEIVANTKDYWRIVLTGTQEKIYSVEKVSHIKYIEQPIEHQTSTVLTELESPEVQFQRWATEIKKLTPETITLGLEFLKNV